LLTISELWYWEKALIKLTAGTWKMAIEGWIKAGNIQKKNNKDTVLLFSTV